MRKKKIVSLIVILLCLVVHAAYIGLNMFTRTETDWLTEDVVHVKSEYLTSDEINRLENLCETKYKESYTLYYVRDIGETSGILTGDKVVKIEISDEAIQVGGKELEVTNSKYLDLTNFISSDSASRVLENKSKYFDIELVMKHVRNMGVLLIGLSVAFYTFNLWRENKKWEQ